MPLKKIIDDNIATLTEVINVVESLSSDNYQRITAPLFTSSIGAHIRHLLEHYQQFFISLDTGKIDYDKRQRQLEIEQCPNFAINALQALIVNLQQLLTRRDNNDIQTVGIYHASSVNDNSHQFIPSTIERELLFLSSHCLHHLAIIAAILRYINVDVDASLGIAPSTLIYQQQQG